MFFLKSSEKIRILSLDRKNNILTKGKECMITTITDARMVAITGEWLYMIRNDHWTFFRALIAAILWKATLRNSCAFQLFSVWIRLWRLCSMVPVLFENCAGVTGDGKSFCGRGKAVIKFGFTYSTYTCNTTCYSGDELYQHRHVHP